MQDENHKGQCYSHVKMNHSTGFAGGHAPKQGLRDRHKVKGWVDQRREAPATCPTLRLPLSSLIKDVSRTAGAIHKKSCWMEASQSGQPALSPPPAKSD